MNRVHWVVTYLELVRAVFCVKMVVRVARWMASVSVNQDGVVTIVALVPSSVPTEANAILWDSVCVNPDGVEPIVVLVPSSVPTEVHAILWDSACVKPDGVEPTVRRALLHARMEEHAAPQQANVSAWANGPETTVVCAAARMEGNAVMKQVNANVQPDGVATTVACAHVHVSTAALAAAIIRARAPYKRYAMEKAHATLSMGLARAKMDGRARTAAFHLPHRLSLRDMYALVMARA